MQGQDLQVNANKGAKRLTINPTKSAEETAPGPKDYCPRLEPSIEAFFLSGLAYADSQGVLRFPRARSPIARLINRCIESTELHADEDRESPESKGGNEKRATGVRMGF